MKKLVLPALVVAALAAYQIVSGDGASPPYAPPTAAVDDAPLARAIESRADGVQVEGRGEVQKILADDEEGSRHQRFLVHLSSGRTILIAHNIDLAPRVAPLAPGDAVAFSGEFAWNAKGGVVHWTHRDPAGRHPAGWIEHDGQLFQ